MLPEDNPLFNNLDKLISSIGLSSEKRKPEEPKLESKSNQDITILQAHAFIEETIKATSTSVLDPFYSAFYVSFRNSIENYLKSDRPLSQRQLNKVWDLAVTAGVKEKINKEVDKVSTAAYSFDKDWYEMRAHCAAFKR